MPDSYYLGMDIGGSHATAALIDADTGQPLPGSQQRVHVDPQGDYTAIVSAWAGLLQRVSSQANAAAVAGLAVAMPGPFDYATGVSKLTGLAKFDRLFGANLRLALGGVLPGVPIWFLNDASAFALGVSAPFAGESVVVLTLGTGLGAAFVRNGRLCTDSADGVPPNGYLYDQPYQDTIIEEWVSSRYLLRRFRELTGQTVTSVARLVKHPDQQTVSSIFFEFGERLGTFLNPYLRRFGADRLVLGGGIARAYDRFAHALTNQLPLNFPVSVESQTDLTNLTGAVQYARQQPAPTTDRNPAQPFRKTEQFLMPARQPAPPDGYDIYPTVALPNGQISTGLSQIVTLLQAHQTVLLDGYVGVLWEPLLAQLTDELNRAGLAVEFRDVQAALKPEVTINQLITPCLGGDDPIFGRICPLGLADFFEADLLTQLLADAPAGRRIIYGPGASLADPDAPVVYVDLPKNELQFRARAGSITNLGAAEPASPKAMYKRFYFVDWPVLNRHKKALLPRLALLIDGQRPNEPTTITGDDFRAALDQTARQPFRVRPWFEPGAWGGQWIKEHLAGLNTDAVNYAWSFELIVPENGLLFASDGWLLEASFDWLMFADNRAVLGKATTRFGDEFPIRFDFLDTIRGGNLSVQCHPRTAYIQEQFGENFTQDETYYILTADPGAEVYLGFQEGVEKDQFADALRTSFDQKTPIDIGQFVQIHPANTHDLFLIPAGTIHCAGAGTMVLEISATPYIYTFKLYDWLRLDLDGQPRPLNIDRGLANLAFERQSDYVQQQLISQPVVIQEDESGQIVHLPTHPDHFYDVHRLEFTDTMTVETHGQCHVLSLVEGQSVVVLTDAGQWTFRYAETFVIPAAVASYQLRSPDASLLKVIKAFVKPSSL